MLALPIAVGVTMSLVASLLATGGRARRGAALALGLAAMTMPYFLPAEDHALRALATILGIGGIIRLSDLVVRSAPTSPLRRAVHQFSMADSFRLRRVAPSLPGPTLLRIALFLPVAIAARAFALDVVPRLATPGTAGFLALRWSVGLVFVYAMTDAVYAALYLPYRAAGWDPPLIHRDPVLSRSVREFWGRRWNRIVSGWLDARFNRPLARRGWPRLGMAAAFVVSALLHAYVAHAALGPTWSLLVGGYFLVQGALALAEGPLGVARWSPPLAHLWTITVMAVTSPLFVEPTLLIARTWP